MVQLGPDGSMMSPLVFGGWEVKQESTNFGIISNTDPHDGLTIGSGPLVVDVPVSTDVTEGGHRQKVSPVGFGVIFLFMRVGQLAILKENRHIVGYLCGHF